MTKEFSPMLFSDMMVRALINKTKTQTRRTIGLDKINENPDEWRFIGTNYGSSGKLFGVFQNVIIQGKFKMDIQFPYGDVGTILWVRETFAKTESFKSNDNNPLYVYRSELSEHLQLLFKWKPSIHMPKKAARIFLKIESFHCERLQDITPDDAKSEGIEFFHNDGTNIFYKDYTDSGKGLPPTVSYISLWVNINGIESANKNPWVWIIKFSQVEKPENFN